MIKDNFYRICSFAFLALFAMTSCAFKETGAIVPVAKAPEVKAAFTPLPISVDGRLSEKVWQETEWIQLDRSRPAKPQNEAEWKNIYKAAGTVQDVIDQFAQQVKFAVVWNEEGLYFGIVAEDKDVQGKYTEDGKWIWLEDVIEIFLSRGIEFPIMEYQLNPSNTVFMQIVEKSQTRRSGFKPESAVYISGSINDSKKLDKFWSAEIFISWSDLEKERLAIKPPEHFSEPQAVTGVRLAAWDLTLYSQIRLNRFSSPGEANPLHPEYYRSLMCLPRK